MKIGARIIKTGIAVTITMFICKMLDLEPAFFGAVSAVINMQPSIFLTITTAKDQIMVHILGVSAGLILGYLLGSNPITMGLITILLIYLHIKFGFKSNITMGIIAALFVLSSNTEQFLPHALIRTAVIFVGLSVAMLINIILWPPRYKQQFKEKLQASNQQAVSYFCQAIQDYVQLENNKPPIRHEQKKAVHKINKESRKLIEFLQREGEILRPGATEQSDWLTNAEKFIDYNQSLIGKADRIYELLPARFDRRQQSGSQSISEEFRMILEILESGCSTIARINGKLRSVIIDEIPAEPEEISEDYWEKLTQAIEHWQPKLTGSYYLHALLDVAVTANEIKWASRQAKKLLYDSMSINMPEG
ncbi:FUSC family protein [Sporomusa malonica]|uniref:Aromatic acid exporter family member 1 n=1 Tax=Sporomusa malonica TaxID=112901 RepID=A0A1W2D227_9FIRM|nr:aromatic acid exporter family protein [Sporomusa malonica]SMC91108.1 Aromatic acid exporter family member 1 [Sporomusa malonica]